VPRETSVAIIGAGSRGLSVLERVLTLAATAGPVRVEVIDPAATGAGVHLLEQPDYLLLNTTCAQVSMFPDAYTVGDEVHGPGLDLYQWVTERGLRIAEDGFTAGSAGRPIRPTDFLPRRVLGQYLQWFFRELLSRVPEHVTVNVHRAEAVDIESDPDSDPNSDPDSDPDELLVTLSDGSRLVVGHAFLTTGYTPNVRAGALPGGDRIIAEPYPLPQRLAGISAGDSVAIGGFGLSAMDVMSCLTVGRGGRFVPSEDRPGQVRYLASGDEPALLFYSRSGVPCRARPRVVEFGDRYQPLVFTRAAIDSARATRNSPLDFERDVLPLVLSELRIAYRRCQARCAGPAVAAAVERELAGAGDAIGAVLDVLDSRLGRFDAAATFEGWSTMSLYSSKSYADWLAATVREDLAEGALGFAGSPVKGALDMLRDLRDVFRHVVDFGGLTPASLENFLARTVPALNRAVVGPQYERHLELLALLECGLASVPFGPAPSVHWQPDTGRWQLTSSRLSQPHRREVDWLAAAWVEPPSVRSSASPLLKSLAGKGMIRAHRPASRQLVGIDIDADQHPFDVDGRIDRRLWVLGPLCEGATFYNNLVPSPATYSRPIHDAHRCVSAMFAADREPAYPR